jgi:hypothetical protein
MEVSEQEKAVLFGQKSTEVEKRFEQAISRDEPRAALRGRRRTTWRLKRAKEMTEGNFVQRFEEGLLETTSFLSPRQDGP